MSADFGRGGGAHSGVGMRLRARGLPVSPMADEPGASEGAHEKLAGAWACVRSVLLCVAKLPLARGNGLRGSRVCKRER